MREVLNNETVQEALLALHDSNLPAEPSDAADAIESVRRHSRAVGWNNCIAALLSTAQPIPPPVPDEETEYQKP